MSRNSRQFAFVCLTLVYIDDLFILQQPIFAVVDWRSEVCFSYVCSSNLTNLEHRVFSPFRCLWIHIVNRYFIKVRFEVFDLVERENYLLSLSKCRLRITRPRSKRRRKSSISRTSSRSWFRICTTQRPRIRGWVCTRPIPIPSTSTRTGTRTSKHLEIPIISMYRLRSSPRLVVPSKERPISSIISKRYLFYRR